MGMIAEIFKPAGWPDCSNNGISNRYQKVCIVNIEGPFEPSADAPAVKLIKRKFGNVVCVPEEVENEWTMMGGAFVHTSDSRFGEAVEKLSGYDFGFPVALHDRVERDRGGRDYD